MLRIRLRRVGKKGKPSYRIVVADVRAPTPSAAAELAVPDAYVLRNSLVNLAVILHRQLTNQTGRRRSELTVVRRRMEVGLPDTQTLRRRVDDVGRVVQSASSRLLSESTMKVDGLGQRLRALDPLATLGRGFSIVQLPDTGQVVSSTKQVSDGDALEITVTDGFVSAVAGPNNLGAPSRQKAKPHKSKRKSKSAQPSGMAPLF